MPPQPAGSADGGRAAQTHTKQHTQRHAARYAAPRVHGKDAAAAAALTGDGGEPARKRVFRPVLTSPYAVDWPRVPKADGEVLMHTLVEVLCDERMARRRSGKRRADGADREPEASTPLVAGINSVTRLLEGAVQGALAGGGTHTSIPDAAATPRLLFVCTGDTDEALVAHLPMLTCSYNAVRFPTSAPSPEDESVAPCAPRSGPGPLLLLPLPQGAEFLLSTALGVRRLSVLLLTDSTPSELLSRLEARAATALGTSVLRHGTRAVWLDRSMALARRPDAAEASLTPTHIKHVSTGAPVNMAQARTVKRESRKAHRAEKRRRRRS